MTNTVLTTLIMSDGNVHQKVAFHSNDTDKKKTKEFI